MIRIGRTNRSPRSVHGYASLFRKSGNTSLMPTRGALRGLLFIVIVGNDSSPYVYIYTTMLPKGQRYLAKPYYGRALFMCTYIHYTLPTCSNVGSMPNCW
ncbi:hypothetical protein F4777DRAFT_122135 [Nemania sp. FL0916]|nr:hypothetical protein F4777DRAFT_122135 [Nemania sp. FL0916]